MYTIKCYLINNFQQERGLQLHEDYEMDEEARFSSVFRRVDDSGFDEKENLLDFRNSETFGDVSGFVVGKSFPDFPSGRSIDAAQLLSISSTMVVSNFKSHYL